MTTEGTAGADEVGAASLAVIIPLHNDGRFIGETLDLVTLAGTRDARHVSPLDDDRLFWRHPLTELARARRSGAWLDALALTRLWGCGPAEQTRVAVSLTKSSLGAALRRARG